jgi:hypothetical protein
MVEKQEMDFAIIEGHRGKEAQNAAFERGASKVQFPNSKHNTYPSQAYDRVPYPIPRLPSGEWDSESPLWDKLAELERRCADELGIKIEQGIRWKMKDKPHTELVQS